MNDLADFRSFERSVMFWLGAQAETLAIEFETQWQRARELVPLIDTSDIDE